MQKYLITLLEIHVFSYEVRCERMNLHLRAVGQRSLIISETVLLILKKKKKNEQHKIIFR